MNGCHNINECHNCMQVMADTMKNNATNSYDFAIALTICLTLLIIAVVAICKWFAYKKFVRKDVSEAAERQQNADIACSIRKGDEEMRSKLLKALADGPQGLKKDEYKKDNFYFTSRCEAHQAYINELRSYLSNKDNKANNENKK